MTRSAPVEPDADPRRPADSSFASRLVHALGTYDQRTYAKVARMSTPLLDEPLSRLSSFANHSKPWFLLAGALAVVGGAKGRQAALTGVAAIGVASLVTNQPMKRLRRRTRPARLESGVPETRWVPMPTSTSFPSGHSASAAAFAVGVGSVLPQLRWPLRIVAGVVGFSRVYTGVHYPGDVLAGATTGVVVGWLTGRARRHLSR